MKKIFITILLYTAVPFPGTAQEFLHLPASEYAITSEEVPHFNTTVELGAINSDAKYAVSLSYPEYEALSATEMKRLKRLDFTPPANITIEQNLTFERKKGYLNVGFAPFVRKGARWLRLTSFKLNVHPLGQTAQVQSKRLPSLLQTTRSSRYADHSVLASGKWVKIKVDKEGIYQINASQLSSMGFSDLSKLKLYGYGGQMLPQVFSFSGANALIDDLQEVPLYRRNGSVLFFSEGVTSWQWTVNRWTHENNPYSSYAYYFLTEGTTPLAFPTLPAVTTTSQTLNAVTSRVLYEKDAFSWFGGGREFVDSHDYATNNKQTYTLAAPNAIGSSNAVVDVAFSAAHTSSNTVAQIQLNSQSLGSISLGTYGEYESAKWASRSFISTALTENNTFSITSTAGHAARLDYIRASYQRSLSATDNGYAFVPNTSGNTALQIANANSNTRIWQLGDGSSTVAEVAGSLNGNIYTANIDAPSRKYVIVDIAASYPTPTIVGTVANQDLHAHTATDMVILLPPSGKFKTQAERIAKAHEAEGLRVRLVNAGDIYNEFSSGTPDAMAYRRYLKMLYDRASTAADAPRYLLLFGGSLWDNRHVTSSTQGLSLDDYLLSYEGNVSKSIADRTIGTLASYVTDDLYGLMDDNEGRNPETEQIDIAIGRFPCRTEAEAKILVDKTLAYLQNGETGVWKNTISILGDEGDNNLHMKGAEAIVKQIHQTTDSTFIVKKFYWDAYKRTATATGNTFPESTQQIRNQMEKGSLIFNYMGHGSPHQISHSQVLFTNDFAKYVSPGSPLWIFASCEITPFDQQEEDLGRVSLFNTQGGSVALLCSSRAVYASFNTSLNVAFAKHVLTEGNTMGDAIRLAKIDMVRNSGDRTVNKMKYNLFADPALVLRRPQAGIVVDSINGIAVSTFSAQQLSAGSVARISGHIAKNGTLDANFKGTIIGSIFDREQTVTCKNNSGGSSGPMVYKDRSNLVYQGTDSVREGRFTLNAIIPRNISYTNDRGRIFLYAVNADRTEEYNGANSQFYFNGTSPSATPDTQGPTLFVYLNSPDFPNGGFVSNSALFGATIKDDAGVSTSGGIGHDMELIIDGDYANSIILNDYFSYDFGSYQSGTVQYALSNLTPGKHTLTFRAWDVNDNSSTAELDFYVGDVQEYDVQTSNSVARTNTTFVVSFPTSLVSPNIVLDIYDVAGRLVWKRTLETTTAGYASIPWNLTAFDGAPLPAGIYIYKAHISSGSIDRETEAKKMIVVKQ